MKNLYPKYFKVTSGFGEDMYELVAFDNALINASLANYNLLRVSSILPIKCKEADNIQLTEGSPLLTAYGTITSNKKGETIASAIGVGIPKDENKVGVIMEYEGSCSAKEAEKTVYLMTERAMVNHGIEVERIITSAIEREVTGEEFVSVISAVAMW